MTTATGTRALIDAVTAGTRTVELGQPLFTGMPCSPNHCRISSSAACLTSCSVYPASTPTVCSSSDSRA